MKSGYVSSRFTDIENAISKARLAASGISDPEVAAYFARYLAVFTCGVYEDCIEHLFVERAGQANDEKIITFMTSTMHLSFRNPNYETIKSHLCRFDTQNGEKLNNLLKPEQIEAINSIKNNKDQVAHGQPCSATILDIESYHGRIKEMFEIIEQILGL